MLNSRFRENLYIRPASKFFAVSVAFHDKMEKS